MRFRTKLLLLATVPLITTLYNGLQKVTRSRRRKQWSKTWLKKRSEGHEVLSMIDNELRIEDPDGYSNYLRMNEEQFNFILNLIEADIKKTNTNMRECIPARKRLLVTLRFLATGESYTSLKFASRIHDSTISVIVPEVCQALYNRLKDDYLKFPNTTKEWENIAEAFNSEWNFPVCLGAIDGKHVNFMAPKRAGSYYFNYKRHHSIVLLAVADANYKFLYVDVGVNGRISDGGVFRESTFKHALDLNLIPFPSDTKLLNTMVPYTFVADEAFPLSKRIMKPYSNRNLSNEKRIFNYRLSRARRVIENAFGILANRFRVLQTTINLPPEKVERIVLACCVLHNFLAQNNTPYRQVEEWSTTLTGVVENQGPNRSASSVLDVRNTLCDYFNSAIGAVPWQNNVLL